MKYISAVVLSVAAIGFSIPASAQFAKAEDAVKYRQSSFSVMGTHFSRLGAMANGKVPFDAKIAEENAELVATLAKLPLAAFGAGTEGGKAKANIWQEQAKFKEHGDKLVEETAKLAVAAKTGDIEKLKASFGAAAATCKACHDSYKNK